MFKEQEIFPIGEVSAIVDFVIESLTAHKINRKIALKAALQCEEAVVVLRAHAPENAEIHVCAERLLSSTRILLKCPGEPCEIIDPRVTESLGDFTPEEAEEESIIRGLLLKCLGNAVTCEHINGQNIVCVSIMEKKPWKLVHAENVVGYGGDAYTSDGAYTSKMLTGDEMAGMPIININQGELAPGGTTAGPDGRGSAHSDTEIYYIIDCDPGTYVWLDDDCLETKPGDIIVIPPNVFHWIDNTKGKKPYKIFTIWPRQEQNGMFFAREKAWGTSVRNLDDDYQRKRLGK